MRIVAKNWENNSNKIKELENRIITKIWSIIISSLTVRLGPRSCYAFEVAQSKHCLSYKDCSEL